MTIERRVRIIADCDPCNPRTDRDCNVGRMICWHSRYTLGDAHHYHSETFMRSLACEYDNGLEEELERLEDDVSNRLYDRAANNGCDDHYDREAYIGRFVEPRINALIEKAIDDGYVVLPIHMYDHSGIILSTGSFGCPWDSGQVGWIVCDKKTIDKEWDGDRDKAIAALEAEVEVYSQYVAGDVWGFVAEQREQYEDTDEADYADEDEWEEVDSCWGFYGSDPETNGIRGAISSDFDGVEFEWC